MAWCCSRSSILSMNLPASVRLVNRFSLTDSSHSQHSMKPFWVGLPGAPQRHSSLRSSCHARKGSARCRCRSPPCRARRASRGPDQVPRDADILRAKNCLMLLQYPDDLLFREAAALNRPSPSMERTLTSKQGISGEHVNHLAPVHTSRGDNWHRGPWPAVKLLSKLERSCHPAACASCVAAKNRPRGIR